MSIDCKSRIFFNYSKELKNLKRSLTLIFSLFFFLSFPKIVSGQNILINEFLPRSNQEWVEFYNKGEVTEDLSKYFFDDDNDFESDAGSSKKFQLAGFLPPKTTCYWDLNNYLNDNGDNPTLFDSNGNIVDSYFYAKTVLDRSYSRVSDGGEWQADQNPTQSSVNCLSLVPSPVPTSTFTPIPTSTLTPTPEPKSIYKINKAKDNNGVELSNVKIYVDDLYTHHVDDETLFFCPGCYCDNEKVVNCGLGEHTIKLEKEGYTEWLDHRNFVAGDIVEVTPILSALPTATPSPNPTATPLPTATNTPKPTITPIPSAITPISTPEGEVLGEVSGETESGNFFLNVNNLNQENEENYQFPQSTQSSSPKKSQKLNFSRMIFPAIFILSGAGFIGFSIYQFIKSKKT